VRTELELGKIEQLLALEGLKAAKTIFCYVSVGDEVSTHGFLEAAIQLKKTVCVPRCLSGNIMEAVAVCGLNELECDYYQIPSVKNKGWIVPASEIDLAVLPCLCADKRGYRIGHGKGYYDRFLAEYQGVSVVLCRKELLADEIPIEPHDQKADLVIAT
jgi:5-formyltetrahydrofolate cyclo-ligase